MIGHGLSGVQTDASEVPEEDGVRVIVGRGDVEAVERIKD